MGEASDFQRDKNQAEFTQQIGEKATRKLRGRSGSSQEVWFGFGMMGLIGWSVVVPALLGAALGTWLDHRPLRSPGAHSWTLALLIAGLCIGCFNAWLWVLKEDNAMKEQQRHDDDLK
jgi:ATP synthase protein I